MTHLLLAESGLLDRRRRLGRAFSAARVEQLVCQLLTLLKQELRVVGAEAGLEARTKVGQRVGETADEQYLADGRLVLAARLEQFPEAADANSFKLACKNS